MLALLSSDRPEEPAAAQSALETVHARVGEPSPSVLSQVATFVARSGAPERPAVPTTVDGWRAWWARVSSR